MKRLTLSTYDLHTQGIGGGAIARQRTKSCMDAQGQILGYSRDKSVTINIFSFVSLYCLEDVIDLSSGFITLRTAFIATLSRTALQKA